MSANGKVCINSGSESVPDEIRSGQFTEESARCIARVGRTDARSRSASEIPAGTHQVYQSEHEAMVPSRRGATYSLLAKSSSELAIEDCQLIYDPGEEPAAQLADQWPSLPSAAESTSELGEQRVYNLCSAQS